MKMYALLFVTLSSIPTICFAAEIKEAKAIAELVQQDQPPVRSLLIFMDTSEEKWGAISYLVIAALEQKVAPIMVPAYLLHQIFAQPTLEEFVKQKEALAKTNPDNKKAHEEYNNYNTLLSFFNVKKQTIKKLIPVYKKNNDAKEFLGSINSTPAWDWQPYWNNIYNERKRSLFSFDPDEWIIYYEQDCYILIPKSYLPFSDKPSPKGAYHLSQEELYLGLKTRHYLSVRFPKETFMDAIKTTAPKVSDYDLAKVVRKLFITRSEYRENSIAEDKVPRWILYVTGHGSLQGEIAGFDTKQFQQLLEFCGAEIFTKLFIYETCYGSSVDAAQLFLNTERKKDVVKSYPFPIMCSAIPDTMVFSHSPRMGIPGAFTMDDIDFERETLRLHTFPDFKKSIALASQEVISYTDLTRALIPESLRLKNIMLVRPAYSEWTSLIDADNIAVSITKTMALTRTKPLILSSLVKKGAAVPQALLLYARHIPFEIIMDTTPLPKLISMIPGKCIHVIDKISIPINVFSFIDNISAILPGVPKVLWIKEVRGKNPVNTENLIIDITNEKNYTIYLTRAGEYRRRSVINGVRQDDDVSEDPEHNYVPSYEKLLKNDAAYQQEVEERTKIQAIARTLEGKGKKQKEEDELADIYG